MADKRRRPSYCDAPSGKFWGSGRTCFVSKIGRLQGGQSYSACYLKTLVGQAIVPAAGFPAGARFTQTPAAWKGGCRLDSLPHGAPDFITFSGLQAHDDRLRLPCYRFISSAESTFTT